MRTDASPLLSYSTGLTGFPGLVTGSFAQTRTHTHPCEPLSWFTTWRVLRGPRGPGGPGTCDWEHRISSLLPERGKSRLITSWAWEYAYTYCFRWEGTIYTSNSNWVNIQEETKTLIEPIDTHSHTHTSAHRKYVNGSVGE